MEVNHKNLKNIRELFFSSLFDSIISFFVILIAILCLGLILKWIFLIADWRVVKLNFPLYLFGSYPSTQLWRPVLWISLIFLLVTLTLSRNKTTRIRNALPFAWLSITPIGIYLLAGGTALLPVESRHWGGLTLTIFLTMCSTLLALPLGIFLALGRQSEFPIIKKISSTYIDVMRAVPLISVLFFGQLLIPLFLPFGLEISRVWRAVFAFSLFVSAYIAEDVRGGLQSIPSNQVEAAKALGLNKIQITQFIVLPQALRIALPALTNQVVGLLQNTSLMAILGLVELLGIGRSLLANPEFIGRYTEVYVWIAALYWFCCTIMALLSRHLEQMLITNKKNFPKA